MESSTRTGKREFIDNDGTRYSFYCNAFKEIIDAMIYKEKLSGNRYTQFMIVEKLSNKISVSPETIRKWLRDNGPADIDKVKDCAEFFSVDYHRLLLPIENKEAQKMTMADKELIRKIYEDMVDILYRNTEAYHLFNNRNKEKEIRLLYNDYCNQTEIAIRNLDRTIDLSGLDTSLNVRDKLHRLVMEFMWICEDGSIHIRWRKTIYNEIMGEKFPYEDELSGLDLDLYSSSPERYDAVISRGSCYIVDEINLAERYEMCDIKQMTQEEFENTSFYDGILDKNGFLTPGFVGDDREPVDPYTIMKFGCSDLTPQRVYMDMATNALNRMFRNDFPEYFE